MTLFDWACILIPTLFILCFGRLHRIDIEERKK